MITALVGLCVPVVAARLVLHAVGPSAVRRSGLLAWALACGVGLGAASALTFIALNVGLHLSPAYAAGDLVVWLGIGAAAWWYGSHVAAGPELPSLVAVSRPSLELRAARGIFVVVAGLSLCGPIVEYLASPHGQWDAWAIWNQKARFMMRAGPGWTASFDIPWSNPSHPVFVALSVARLWAYAGGEPTVVPAILSGVYGVTTAALVVGALGVARTRAWLAGAVLVAPFSFSHLVAAQTADLPFSLFVVASLALVLTNDHTFWARTADARRALWLSGVCAGLAAWTKNEGIVFLVASAVLLSWATWRYGRLRDVCWWAAGVAPALALLAWLKLFLSSSAPEYVAGATSASVFGQVLSVDRHARIWALLWQHAATWGGPMARWTWPAALVVATAYACTVAGRSSRGVLFVVTVMCLGYYAVYLLTPIDLTWLLATTFERLALQLWPSLVLALFLGAASDAAGALREKAR